MRHLLALLLLLPIAAAAQPKGGGDLAGLAAWVGCYPTCNRNTLPAGQRPPPMQEMLAFPPLEGALGQLMGGPALAAMRRINQVQSPVERRGDWITAGGCKQHECDRDAYVLFVNLASGQLVVCRTLPGSRGTVWRSGAGPVPPPPGGCDRRGQEPDNWPLLQRLLAQ